MSGSAPRCGYCLTQELPQDPRLAFRLVSLHLFDHWKHGSGCRGAAVDGNRPVASGGEDTDPPRTQRPTLMQGVYIILHRYYVKSCRELGRLQSMTRSPVFSQYAEMLDGQCVGVLSS